MAGLILGRAKFATLPYVAAMISLISFDISAWLTGESLSLIGPRIQCNYRKFTVVKIDLTLSRKSEKLFYRGFGFGFLSLNDW